VAIIDREIDQILYETRVRKELFANTAGAGRLKILLV